MNARLYDPVVGRFLSPDPYVQAPDFSQNFNRYSYALNNPFRYSDPSGEAWHILIGGVVGGIVNLGYKAFTGQINSWGDGFMAFGIGFVAGAAGTATGGAAFAAAGGGAAGAGGFLAGAWSSIIGYIGSVPFENLANHIYFGDALMGPLDHAKGMAIAGATGGALNGFSAYQNGGKNVFSGNEIAQGRSAFAIKNTPVKPKFQPTKITNEVGLLDAPKMNISLNEQMPRPNMPESNLTTVKYSKSIEIQRLDEATFNASYLSPKEVGNYTVYSNNGLVGDTYNVNIFYLESSGNTGMSGMRSLLNTYENAAINAGANKISIYGSTVINQRLLNPAVINRLGYSYEEVGKSIILQKVIK